MKITIEVPDKFIEIAKGLVLAECKNSEDELHIEETANLIKDTAEPILVSQDAVKDVCGDELDHMNMLFALFAFNKVLKDKNY